MAAYQGLISSAAAAEWAAIESWQPPTAGGVARWGKRQTRTEQAWATRWRGVAQCPLHGKIRMYYESSFDDTAAGWTVGRRRRDWGARQRPMQNSQNGQL